MTTLFWLYVGIAIVLFFVVNIAIRVQDGPYEDFGDVFWGMVIAVIGAALWPFVLPLATLFLLFFVFNELMNKIALEILRKTKENEA